MLKEVIIRQQITGLTKRLLKTPAATAKNGSGPLEITVVIDCSLEKTIGIQLTKELAEVLKKSGELFQNVRVNTVFWSDQDKLEVKVSGLSSLILGRGFEEYTQTRKKKDLGQMLDHLKRHHARSKIIYFFTDNQFSEQQDQIDVLLKPFVGDKTIWFILGTKKKHFQNHVVMIEVAETKKTGQVIHQFAPVFNQESRILVLGTIPSPKSREQGFYYGHPRNRFWKVLADLFDEPLPETVEAKISLCLKHRVAIWDVLASCEIEGASDSSIKNPVPNDMSVILNQAPIEAIYTTGTKAFSLYQTYCYPKTGMAAKLLPSTSPANCRMSFEQLKEAYAILLCNDQQN